MNQEQKLFFEMTYKKITFDQFIDEIKRIGVSEHYASKNNNMTPEQKTARAKKAANARWSNKVAPKTEQ